MDWEQNLKPLSLRRVNDLYKLLKPYLPEKEGIEILYYIGIIIDRIASQNKEAYIQALEIMVGQSREILLRLNGDELYQLFVDGIKSNRLDEFQMMIEGLET